MTAFVAFFNRVVTPALTALSENTYFAAIRAGLVSLVPLTIIGGVFLIVGYFPAAGWSAMVAPYLPVLQVPVSATFGLLSLFLAFSVGYHLADRLEQEPLGAAVTAALVFLLIHVEPGTGGPPAFRTDQLGSQGLFAAILVALACVRFQKLMTDWNIVIRLPASVPAVVYHSFVSLIPALVLVLVFWTLRFVVGIDLNAAVHGVFAPLVLALNTLPGILACVFLITLLWSVGINGDNALDAIVAPVFLQYLAANVEAVSAGQPLPFVTAQGFISTFVNVGGTGATLGLTLVMLWSKEPGYRQISRMSLPTQIFQINEPIFFGFPIVLNPMLMVPYVLTALVLAAGTYGLMAAGMIGRPLVNVPWTTPPILGHYLITGGDWRAAVWGVVSLAIAMAVYYPFARLAERQRLRAQPPDERR